MYDTMQMSDDMQDDLKEKRGDSLYVLIANGRHFLPILQQDALPLQTENELQVQLSLPLGQEAGRTVILM